MNRGEEPAKQSTVLDVRTVYSMCVLPPCVQVCDSATGRIQTLKRPTHTGRRLHFWYVFKSLRWCQCLRPHLHPLSSPSLPIFLCTEWATDQVLFYTTAQGLRSSRVCRLDLNGCVHSITSVYEEQQPE